MGSRSWDRLRASVFRSIILDAGLGCRLLVVDDFGHRISYRFRICGLVLGLKVLSILQRRNWILP